MANTLNFVNVDPRNATDAQYAAFNDFSNIIRRERLPDDPPIPLEETVQGNRNIPDFVDVETWVVTAAGSDQILAVGSADVVRTDGNQHVAEFSIEVHPGHRRRGIGRALLARAAEFASREARTLMLANSNSRVPAGEAFLRRIGATVGLSMHTNQLLFSDLDRGLLRRWVTAGERVSGEFTLGEWIGDYPEDELQTIAELFNVMNHQPRDSLQIEDWTVTPEILRQFEKSWAARKVLHWTLYVRHNPSGNLAGFTDVTWTPTRPQYLNQGNTGVWPAYRGNGLGRWMKAAMLEKVLRELPEVTTVRTGNAFSNAPMLKINQELGFKPYFSAYTWQVQRSQVEAYLLGT